MTQRYSVPLTAAALLVLAGLGPDPAAAASIKCWTNNEGVRECGNSVPPEYAQKGHEEKSATGITVEEQSRAMTEEELAAEREERERLAAEQAEEERRRKQEAERDRVLLATFTTVDDLILTRDGQLQAIDSRISHTRQTIDKLREQIDELQAEAAEQERAGKKVDDKLRANITSVKQQIAENLEYIEQRQKEKVALTAKYEKDLARYRELKGLD